MAGCWRGGEVRRRDLAATPHRKISGEDHDRSLNATVPVDVGAASTAIGGEDLEVAHVVWYATGHDDVPTSRWRSRHTGPTGTPAPAWQ